MKKKIIKIFLSIIVCAAISLPTTFALRNEYEERIPAATLVPDLVYSPMSHDFGNVALGQTYQTTFQIWNGGTDLLTWNLGIVHTWISPSPTSGSSTSFLDKDTVTVTIDTSGMSLGPHSGFVSISANDGGGNRYFNIDINIVDSNPPNTPGALSGPTIVQEDVQNQYFAMTTDPDGDQVKYGIDFNNDGIVEPDHWTSFSPSGYNKPIGITFHSIGTYYLKIKAEDEHGLQSGFSPALTVVVTGANNVPDTPDQPSGPITGEIDIAYSYSTSAVDPDDDDVKYYYDWGDGTGTWTSFVSSGSSSSKSHSWIDPGIYEVRVKAQDEHGAESGWSTILFVAISGGNNAPIKPTQPEGESSGKTGVSYTYSTSTTDPDSDRVYYFFDWGDGTDSGWTGPYDSGDIVYQSHSWTAQGDYVIKVKAKDDPDGDGDLSDGIESVWSDPLQISMPKNKVKVHSIQRCLKEIFERYNLYENLFKV